MVLVQLSCDPTNICYLCRFSPLSESIRKALADLDRNRRKFCLPSLSLKQARIYFTEEIIKKCDRTSNAYTDYVCQSCLTSHMIYHTLGCWYLKFFIAVQQAKTFLIKQLVTCDGSLVFHLMHYALEE